MDYDATFPCSFEVSVTEGHDQPSEVDFIVEGLPTSALRAVIEVSSPDAHWRGNLYGGDEGLHRLVNSPDPLVLLASVGGVGYSIPVGQPHEFVVIPLRPVIALLPDAEAGLVIAAGHTRVAAFSKGPSPLWVSPRLASDGFDEVRPASSVVVLRYWDAPSHGMVEIQLDSRTGERMGGAN